MVYYNEFDKGAAAWLRELIGWGILPYGEVDERSITEVRADELRGYAQCHFFAGIGGWALALQLAGWPSDREAWTGSCPCQPFSVAGKGQGGSDPRHLWPTWRGLVNRGKPAVVFGEQVASKAGRLWYAGVRSNLETMGYASGCADLCAAGYGEKAYGEEAEFLKGLVESGDARVRGRELEVLAFADELAELVVGAPHIRQRLWWGAVRLADEPGAGAGSDERGLRQGAAGGGAGSGSGGGISDAKGAERERVLGGTGSESGIGLADSGGVDHAFQSRLEGHAGDGDGGDQPGRDEADAAGSATEAGAAGGGGLPDPNVVGERGEQRARELEEPERDKGVFRGVANASGLGRAKATDGEGQDGQFAGAGEGSFFPWSDFDVVPCRDGKARRLERGTEPLVDGIPEDLVRDGHPSLPDAANSKEGRSMRLKGYGNAIVPQEAAAFVECFVEAVGEVLPTNDTNFHEGGKG